MNISDSKNIFTSKFDLWKIFACVLFSICTLLFPYLFAFKAYNADIELRLFIVLIYTIIVCGTLICLSDKTCSVLSIFICIIAYVPNITVLSYLLMDNYIMKSTDFWVVFNTNQDEAFNLLSTIDYSVIIATILYTIMSIFSLIILLRVKEKRKNSLWTQMIAILILAVITFIYPFRSKVSAIDFYKSFWHYKCEQKEVSEFYKNRNNIKLDVEAYYPDGKNTLLIIIGESQNRQHMQLYGYTRETNPLMNEIKDELTIYEDVCSPAIQTLVCMKQIFTFSNYEHPDLYKKEANIIELLKSARYKTFWLDNQGPDNNSAFAIDYYTPTSYRTIAKQCDFYYACGNSNDSIVINLLEAALNDTAVNKAIFVHLVGNHFDYSNRFESSYAFFNDTVGINSPYLRNLSENDIRKINDYDNATRYNDYIVRTCIEQLRQSEGRSAMLYFPDHGEEVYDFQNYCTRSFERISPAMCEIPMILWLNKHYINSSNLCLDEKKPLCTDDIIYGIMDLAGIKYCLYDSTRSVFNNNFIPKERMVQKISLQSIRDKYFFEKH